MYLSRALPRADKARHFMEPCVEAPDAMFYIYRGKSERSPLCTWQYNRLADELFSSYLYLHYSKNQPNLCHVLLSIDTLFLVKTIFFFALITLHALIE